MLIIRDLKSNLISVWGACGRKFESCHPDYRQSINNRWVIDAFFIETRMKEDPRHIHISEYNYPLPDERIAKFPLTVRDQSKLLVYRHGEVTEDVFTSLPDYLPKGSLMVFNNTKVIQARLHFRKETGALIEVFCLEPIQPNDYVLNFQQTEHAAWLCMIGNLKKWKDGALKREMTVKGFTITLTATRGECRGTSHWIDFSWNNPEVTFADILEVFGELPIPPYLNRDTEESDKETYQTVYSKIKGSVAAPTAGLHFTPRVLEALQEKGIDLEELTLHVGAGTFKPVKSETLEGHEMHTEFISVRRSSIERIKSNLGNIIAVGTTSVRTLESLYYMGVILDNNPEATSEDLVVKQWMPYDMNNNRLTAERSLQNILDYLDKHDADTLVTATQIIIAPGYEPEALTILAGKKKGNYNVVAIDPDYKPNPVEHKQVYGITFEQGRNELAINAATLLTNCLTETKTVTEEQKRDLIIALITLKYTQSNSVCYTAGGQTIGVGAGQQSRIHCTRLAGQKADNWQLRHMDKVLNLPFRDDIAKPNRDNAIDVYIGDTPEDVIGDDVWAETFTRQPEPLTAEEKKEYLSHVTGVCLGSDAFFPFGDNIERARRSGVTAIVQPGGSIRDQQVIDTCNKYGIAMAFCGIRLFHH